MDSDGTDRDTSPTKKARIDDSYNFNRPLYTVARVPRPLNRAGLPDFTRNDDAEPLRDKVTPAPAPERGLSEAPFRTTAVKRPLNMVTPPSPTRDLSAPAAAPFIRRDLSAPAAGEASAPAPAA